MYTPVAASLLAIMANDNAVSLIPRGVLGFIASELAPTGFGCQFFRLACTAATPSLPSKLLTPASQR